jgi:DNA-binding transcriptional LysR family regulator
MQRDTWAELATFAAIVDAGGFTPAARRLDVSPSALSHAMRGLETRLGVRLLNRTTRSVAPTEAGERLLASLTPAIASVTEALATLDASREQPTGRLRISAHRTAALHSILPRVPAFLARYPDIRLELSVEDGLIDIVAGRFDAGVRHSHVLQPDMISVRIDDGVQLIVAASPAYLATNGAPVHPSDLLAHRCLNYRYTTSGRAHRWLFEKDGEALQIDTPAWFVSNDTDVLLAAAIEGCGVACLTEPAAATAIASGALVGLLPDWCPRLAPNFLYYPGRQPVAPALRAFIEVMRVG